MNSTTGYTTQQKAAVFSGVALLIMTVAAFFAQGYVHSSLVVEGDATTTLSNIQANLTLFRLELFGWSLIVLLDLIVAWGFYLFLKPYRPGYALLAGGLRVFYTVILAIAVYHLLNVDQVIRSSDGSAEQVMRSLTAFERTWSFGLILFGLHLIAVGLAAFGTTRIPKIIAALLVLAGVSYSLIHFLYGFFPQLADLTARLELVLIAPMFIGELAFGIWLLVKGRKVDDTFPLLHNSEVTG
ncbi:DUF4386 domain-containing protein [Exiguobacterium algae]|uniref:DUF4386 domain-containing protein n=1 Tax=Exiguobacterium algae TaxID=2751250 RepID=UPI001BEB7842|nr:DUF4386 domain-containing protein [Exiguobacterium algae]